MWENAKKFSQNTLIVNTKTLADILIDRESGIIAGLSRGDYTVEIAADQAIAFWSAPVQLNCLSAENQQLGDVIRSLSRDQVIAAYQEALVIWRGVPINKTPPESKDELIPLQYDGREPQAPV